MQFLSGYQRLVLRKPPKEIPQPINRRRHQPGHRLKRRPVRCVRMRAARHKHLGTTKGLGKSLTVSGSHGFFKAREVTGFFFFDVVGEVFHERFNGGHEVGIGGVEVLEFVELVFDLRGPLVISCRYESLELAEEDNLALYRWSSKELSIRLGVPHGLLLPKLSHLRRTSPRLDTRPALHQWSGGPAPM